MNTSSAKKPQTAAKSSTRKRAPKPTCAQFELTNDDLYLLARGEWYRSYEKMGAHPCVNEEGKRGYHFAVWVPFARSVRVVGDFNNWDDSVNYLTCSESGGVWQGFIAGAKAGQCYKYAIETDEGEQFLKADPYAFATEAPPETASRLEAFKSYKWRDARWIKKRDQAELLHMPLNIFEVHLGSWKRHNDGLEGNGSEPPSGGRAGGSYLSYLELAEDLVNYAKDMGYTHLEFLPVMEHPFDGSWGYQITGFFAPTARFGKPDEFRALVEAAHKAGLGVILDWVPSGFCRDAHGLGRFNGHKLYEYADNPSWGTYKFDFGRGEVRSFLISNLLYWIDEFHVDGIRVDGVTSMLYLNFGIEDKSQHRFNERGTSEDDTAIAFLRQCNKTVGEYHPTVMMIAEESTAWPLVTYPPYEGGLGFNFKWDMGWMHDTLHYMQTDFPFRPGVHRWLTFSTMYQCNENFVLSLSHDEVVHGKCSLIQRMPGDYWRQFAGMRALALYQMTHMGAKLNFMGNEIAQFIEWRYYEGVEYFLSRDYEKHGQLQRFIAELNALYREQPALWELSYEYGGFEWVDADNNGQSIVVYCRRGRERRILAKEFIKKEQSSSSAQAAQGTKADAEGALTTQKQKPMVPREELVVLINFDVAARENFRVGVPIPGRYEEIISSDAERFGGSGVCNEGLLKTEDVAWNGREQSLVVRVPPLGGVILRRVSEADKKRQARRASTQKGSKVNA